jgi:glutamyl-tRNA synthetase
MPPVHTRLAPTPSGYLHKGNAYNFLLAYRLVRQYGGTLRLRIDDLDVLRLQPEHVQEIFDGLNWLGIQWQRGPVNAEEHYACHSRQLRIPYYHQLIEQLIVTGEIFACTCSRREIHEQQAHGRYPGTCRHRNLPLHYPNAALRILVPENTIIRFTDKIKGEISIDLAKSIGDFVIRRKDRLPAYHIASLTDDVDHGINTIVRGEDLLESTAAQLFLAKKLNLQTFETAHFYHHHLLTDDEGKKLSKSAGSASLKWLRENGILPEEIMAR